MEIDSRAQKHINGNPKDHTSIKGSVVFLSGTPGAWNYRDECCGKSSHQKVHLIVTLDADNAKHCRWKKQIAFNKLSKELEKRDMLIPAEIILNNIPEDRADIPINAIHMYSGLKADVYPVREGDELRHSAFQRRQQVDYGPPIRKVYIHSLEDLILYKLMYFGLSQQSKHSRDIAAILKAKKTSLI